MQTIADKLVEREQRRDVLAGELQALEDQIAAAAKPVSRDEILVLVKQVAGNLTEIDDESREVLRQLTTPIEAVPFQRIDCGLVVLRARFKVNLVGLLPAQWQQLIQEADADLSANELLSREIEVPLYDEPLPVRLAWQAKELYDSGLISDKLAAALGTNGKSAYEAVRFAEWMLERGLAEPYVELTEEPKAASRWGSRQAGGGPGDMAAG